MYAAANRILGRIPKVTPSSKVVGDLALHLAASDADPDDFAENPQNYDIPDSVVGFMAGELGELPGGWPEPFRTKVLAGKTVKVGVEDVSATDAEALEGSSTERRAALNRLLFPAPTRIFEQIRELFGDLSVVDTVDYLYGLGAGRGARRRDQQGRAALHRPGGDRRGRREGHAHGHDHAQRPAAAGVRARSQHRRGGQSRREGRHGQAGSRRRAVLRCCHPPGRCRAMRWRPGSRSPRSRP